MRPERSGTRICWGAQEIDADLCPELVAGLGHLGQEPHARVAPRDPSFPCPPAVSDVLASCACPDPRDVGDMAPSPTFVEGLEACSVHVLSVSPYSERPRLVLELNVLETSGF